MITPVKNARWNIQEEEVCSSSETLRKFLSYTDTSFNDSITLHFANNNTICGLYIPPSDSPYFKDHFEHIVNTTQSSFLDDKKLLVIGDLNCRMGDLGVLNSSEYSKNLTYIRIVMEKNF